MCALETAQAKRKRAFRVLPKLIDTPENLFINILSKVFFFFVITAFSFSIMHIILGFTIYPEMDKFMQEYIYFNFSNKPWLMNSCMFISPMVIPFIVFLISSFFHWLTPKLIKPITYQE